MATTPIGARIELLLDEEYLRMQNEWFFKWHFIGSDGPVEIESFRGKPIRYGGLKFEGSPQNVYWDTIQFYLRKKVASVLDQLEKDLREYPLETRRAALSEASSALQSFATKIRKAAVEKDRILRGDGINFPSHRDRGAWRGSQPSEIQAKIESLETIYCHPTLTVDGVEMPFRSLLKDKVTFAKKDGTVFRKDIAASVQTKKIFVFDSDLPIEVGDHFLRQLPSGLVEDFIVDDPGFMAGVGGAIQAHFETSVHRSDQPPAQPQTVINNIVGDNARVNINSIDNSTNAVGTNSPALFAEMLKAVVEIQNSSDREMLTTLIGEMAAAHQRKDGTFVAKYQSFVTTAANHITILAPFLPALSRLIS